MRPTVRGIGPASLQPNPARSYAQPQVQRATDGCTSDQLRDDAPSAASKITAGDPDPEQATCSRCPPTSTNRPRPLSPDLHDKSDGGSQMMHGAEAHSGIGCQQPGAAQLADPEADR